MTLWVSTDGSGDSWREYSLSNQHNRLVQDPALRFSKHVNDTDLATWQTSSYTSLLSVGERTALVIYDKRAGGEAGPGSGAVFAMRLSFESA